MAGKRARDVLTGGSNDVNPQIMTVSAVQTGADAATVIGHPLPIPRLPTTKDHNLVMEFLYIDYYHLNPINPGAGAAAFNLITVTTSPAVAASIVAGIQDPRLVDAWYKLETTLTAVGNVQEPVEYCTDLTDKAGHGVLVAADTINIGVYSTGTAVANSYVVKVGYRWKTVSLTEYIGIVQSQQ